MSIARCAYPGPRKGTGMRSLRTSPASEARYSAAPSALPSSPAAGCTYTSSNTPEHRSFPLAVQFSATPPVSASRRCPVATAKWLHRSEEHTSELQSRFDLVCRLLLEKKKKKNNHQ